MMAQRREAGRARISLRTGEQKDAAGGLSQGQDAAGFLSGWAQIPYSSDDAGWLLGGVLLACLLL